MRACAGDHFFQIVDNLLEVVDTLFRRKAQPLDEQRDVDPGLASGFDGATLRRVEKPTFGWSHGLT